MIFILPNMVNKTKRKFNLHQLINKLSNCNQIWYLNVNCFNFIIYSTYNYTRHVYCSYTDIINKIPLLQSTNNILCKSLNIYA